MSIADEIAKLNELREQNILTEEEFNAQKAKLLGGETASEPAPAAEATEAPPQEATPEKTGDAAAQAPTGEAPPKSPAATPAQAPKPPAQGGLSGAAITWIVVGSVILVTLVVVAVFVLKGESAAAKTTEAVDQLDKIYKGASVYYSTPHVLDTGQKVPCQFPANQGVTPVEGTCCSTGGLGGPDNNQDDRCDANPAVWDEAVWSSLSFQMYDEHYFVYAFDSEGTLKEANFRATANADLDCDSIQSTFQRIAFGDEEANFAECALHGAPAMFVDQETE